MYDGATCFLVSQFILSQPARSDFFREIGSRLVPGAILASSDLASDADPNVYEVLLRVWINVMSSAGVEPEVLERARAAYAKDVAILQPALIAAIIESGGFDPPVQFYQAGLLHAWRSKRSSSNAA
jgi:tRNA (cmo5U34)-methyltransferase